MTDKKVPSASTTPAVIQRGDEIRYESRDGEDRRGDNRGLNPGRRLSDHHRVRSLFNKRIESLVREGHSAESVAVILNDEDFQTAGGEQWTADAIIQLLDTLKQRRSRDAWLPTKLEPEEGVDDQ